MVVSGMPVEKGRWRKAGGERPVEKGPVEGSWAYESDLQPWLRARDKANYDVRSDSYAYRQTVHS